MLNNGEWKREQQEKVTQNTIPLHDIESEKYKSPFWTKCWLSLKTGMEMKLTTKTIETIAK